MKTPTAHLVPPKLRGKLNKLGREIGQKGYDAVFAMHPRDWNPANEAIAKALPVWFENTPAEILDQPAVYNMFIEKIFEGFADRYADETIKRIAKEYFT